MRRSEHMAKKDPGPEGQLSPPDATRKQSLVAVCPALSWVAPSWHPTPHYRMKEVVKLCSSAPSHQGRWMDYMHPSACLNLWERRGKRNFPGRAHAGGETQGWWRLQVRDELKGSSRGLEEMLLSPVLAPCSCRVRLKTCLALLCRLQRGRQRQEAHWFSLKALCSPTHSPQCNFPP